MKQFILVAIIVVMISLAGLLYVVRQASYYADHAKQAVAELTDELDLNVQEANALTTLAEEWQALHVGGELNKEEIKLRLAEYLTEKDPQYKERVRVVLDEAEKKIDEAPTFEQVKQFAAEQKQRFWRYVDR